MARQESREETESPSFAPSLSFYYAVTSRGPGRFDIRQPARTPATRTVETVPFICIRRQALRQSPPAERATCRVREMSFLLAMIQAHAAR